MLSVPLSALADVSVKFDLSGPTTRLISSPFPSDRYTVRDWSNATLRRVNLPKPDCTVHVSDCEDITVINQLDGFSTQPRITVPFTGAIDVASVNSDSVYLLNLGDTLTFRGFGQKVGINQILWDPATLTMVFVPKDLLNEHSRCVLIVTNAVRDTAGKRIKRSGVDDDDHGPQSRRGNDNDEYRRDLRDKVVATSWSTTQSSTADLTKIMLKIKQSNPAPASFMVGSVGGVATRAVFPTAGIAGIQFSRQVAPVPPWATRRRRKARLPFFLPATAPSPSTLTVPARILRCP